MTTDWIVVPAGTVASKYREGQDEYDIRVRLREADRRELADLDRIFVTAPGGQQILLRNLTLTREGTGPIVIKRRGQERAVTVQAGMTGTRDFGSIATEIERHPEAWRQSRPGVDIGARDGLL